ncbi:hypothetical protein CVT25_013420 [Psilocybe cyanescens]|uniref:Uncharacterized protein n=1 Tax=Psilocybe cyanescens TaxID=93625 RepID=A0A409WST4_PSICY|nr:hypothetical protein CVT25_013420 [Psilocybe cyanescens]
MEAELTQKAINTIARDLIAAKMFSLASCAFHDARWSREVCNRYVLFPEALKTVTTFVIGVDLASKAIFITRIYAIYSRKLGVLIFGVCLLVAELAVKIVLWAVFWSADITRQDIFFDLEISKLRYLQANGFHMDCGVGLRFCDVLHDVLENSEV